MWVRTGDFNPVASSSETGAGVGAAGGAGLGAVVTVLSNMHLGGLARRLAGRSGAPPLSRAQRAALPELGITKTPSGLFRIPLAGGTWLITNRRGVERYLRGGAQAGTVTNLPPPKSPPPPTPDTPPPSSSTPIPVVGPSLVWTAAMFGAQYAGNAIADWQRRKAEAEKKRKQAAAKAKKEAEARAKKAAAEKKKRDELMYRATHGGRAPPTSGRGPITGPTSGYRTYDLPKNPAAPPKPGRTSVDVYQHAPAEAPREVIRPGDLGDPWEKKAYDVARSEPMKLPKTAPGGQIKWPTPYALPPSPWYGSVPGVISTARTWYPLAALALPVVRGILPSSSSRKKPAASPAIEPPLTSPSTGALQLPQAWPSLALAPASSAKCHCPSTKKKKRGPKKRRTVCYSGSYTERASGLSKRKRKQVPCK